MKRILTAAALALGLCAYGAPSYAQSYMTTDLGGGMSMTTGPNGYYATQQNIGGGFSMGNVWSSPPPPPPAPSYGAPSYSAPSYAEPLYAAPSYAAPSPIPQHSVDAFAACVKESMDSPYRMKINVAFHSCIRSGETKYHWSQAWLVDACVAAAMPLTAWPDSKVRPQCERDYYDTVR